MSISRSNIHDWSCKRPILDYPFCFLLNWNTGTFLFVLVLHNHRWWCPSNEEKWKTFYFEQTRSSIQWTHEWTPKWANQIILQQWKAWFEQCIRGTCIWLLWSSSSIDAFYILFILIRETLTKNIRACISHQGDFRKLNKMPKTTAAKIASNGPWVYKAFFHILITMQITMHY